MALPSYPPGLQSWEDMSANAKEARVAGLLAANAKKKVAAIARLGQAKKCACGCGAVLKPGRTWVSGHNAGITPRHYSADTLKQFALNGARTAKLLASQGRTPGPDKLRGGVLTEEHKHKCSVGSKLAVVEGRLDVGANSRKGYRQADPESEHIACRSKVAKHGSFYSQKMGRSFFYESSWELARMKCFEEDNNIIFYLRSPFRIGYMIDAVEHSYFPDFSVFQSNGDLIIEEIKPAALLNYGRNPIKIDVLQKHCEKAGYICRVLTTLESCKEKIYYAPAS